MERRTVGGGNLTSAGYDEAAGILEITFADGSVKRFKAVQAEVWRRLIASPNPASFYADRIEEEYPLETSRATHTEGARKKLDSLFDTGLEDN